MAEVEQKKDKFYLAINHYAEEQRQKIENEIAAYKKKELEDAEIEVLTECYHMIQKELAQMRNGISRELAKREMDNRRSLLEKRKKITEDVFQKAAEKLKEYTLSDSYKDFLQKSAREFGELFHESGTVLLLRPEDMKYEQTVRDAFGSPCQVQPDSSIEIGGIRAENRESGLAADNTFRSLLNDQRGWFEEHSGMAVASAEVQ